MRKYSTPRRLLLQGLLGALALPFVRAPRAAAAQTLNADLIYTDSEGTADLSSLRDGAATTGGITYGA